MWDLIVSVPDHCLSFYFESQFYRNKEIFSLLNFHFGIKPFLVALCKTWNGLEWNGIGLEYGR